MNKIRSTGVITSVSGIIKIIQFSGYGIINAITANQSEFLYNYAIDVE
jgi:hypothetical protein